MLQHVFLLAVALLPFIGSLVTAVLPRNATKAAATVAGATALSALALTASFYPSVTNGGVLKYKIEWLPQLGLDLILRIDGFAWSFLILIFGIGLLVVLYARYYMSPSDPVSRFFSLLLAFMGAMTGIVLSGNIIQLVFCWELTSIFSFLLIGYWHQNAPAREGARMALIVTGAGGLCLFSGIILLGHVVGSYDLDAVLAAGHIVRNHPLYLPILILVLLGAFTKSAQFPFQFWLPEAMAAPTPVSAYLHSATMVKAGVFLLVRFWPVLGGTNEWLWLVSSAGLLTFVLGAFIAIFQQDLKGLLAYSTISHLGLITLLIGLDRPLALIAAIFHIINHATFKASLFMAAGIIDHESGTRDIRRLSGLWKFMPITATLAIVAAASMAGVPLLNGFLSKEMFFAETIETHDGSLIDDLLPYIVTAASTFSVAYSLRFIKDVFFGPPATDLPKTPHEPPRWMRFPIEFLVVLCLVIGIAPGLTVGWFLDTASIAVLGTATPHFNLAVWHGLNWPLLMSFVALVGGILLYAALQPYLRLGFDGAPLFRHLDPARIFERLLLALSTRWARGVENLISSRHLQPQLRLIILFVVIAGAVPLVWAGLPKPGLARTPVAPILAGVWVLGIVCAVGSAYMAKFHRLAALVLLGGAGMATCITFVWFSAPDLALTQLVVEVVTLVLLLLGVRWLPKRTPKFLGPMPFSVITRRGRDLTLAALAGFGMAGLAYSMMTQPVPDSISEFFLENAYAKGGGTNVVNVILVDFRGFDTMGEITVLGVVALSVFALLRRFRPAADSIPVPEQQRQEEPPEWHAEAGTGTDYLVVPGLVMQLLFPVIAIVAAFFFLRGHDQPGGGFVAGVTMAIAFILQYMATGIRVTEQRLRILPVRWIGFGLLTALAAGAGAWLFGRPLLTSYATYLKIPLIGDVPLATAILFDLGVFSLVLGATILMLVALAHQSIRSHRASRAEDA